MAKNVESTGKRVITHNDDPSLDINWTGLKGYLNISGKILEKNFGKPIFNDDNWAKVRFEWEIKIDNTIITIYTWKAWYPPPESHLDWSEWNIGGHNTNAVIKLRTYLGLTDKECYVDSLARDQEKKQEKNNKCNIEKGKL